MFQLRVLWYISDSAMELEPLFAKQHISLFVRMAPRSVRANVKERETMKVFRLAPECLRLNDT
jgi:hypothetical protein